jgi:hypothetical protein
MTNEVREIFEFLASGGRSILYNYDYGSSSRAASTQDIRETEVADGLILSKRTTTKNEPVVIDLQEYAKSKAKGASTPPTVNPVREIFDFLNGRY